MQTVVITDRWDENRVVGVLAREGVGEGDLTILADEFKVLCRKTMRLSPVDGLTTAQMDAAAKILGIESDPIDKYDTAPEYFTNWLVKVKGFMRVLNVTEYAFEFTD